MSVYTCVCEGCTRKSSNSGRCSKCYPVCWNGHKTDKEKGEVEDEKWNGVCICVKHRKHKHCHNDCECNTVEVSGQ